MLPEPLTETAPTRLDGFLRGCETLWLRTDRCIQRFLPAELNPLTQLGALANAAPGIAVVSGIILLLWYSPSVTQAHASLERPGTESWLGQWKRSIHRYSSDACLFLILLHAALGVARLLDHLPLFAEPFSRSFLTDQTVPSLLFFLVFFAHMLAPLALGIGIWIHLMRVNRAQFLPRRRMTAWLTGSLMVISILVPATSAAPARMMVKSSGFTMDWWYLWPVAFTDRLGGGVLWVIGWGPLSRWRRCPGRWHAVDSETRLPLRSTFLAAWAAPCAHRTARSTRSR